MPVRRGPARLPEHRRARPRRRPVRRGPLRRRGRPRRSGHLLLSRRAGLAILLPLHDRAQHGRARRAEPVHARAVPFSGCGTPTPGRSTSRDDGEVVNWTAEHDGLQRSRPAGPAPPHGPAGPGLAQHRHRRRDRRRPRRPPCLSSRPRRARRTRRGQRDPKLARRAGPGAARLDLPRRAAVEPAPGESDPILGWYSSGLGRRVPAVTLLGCGRSAPGESLRTRLQFVDAGTVQESAFTQPTVSWFPSDPLAGEMRGIQAEAE